VSSTKNLFNKHNIIDWAKCSVAKEVDSFGHNLGFESLLIVVNIKMWCWVKIATIFTLMVMGFIFIYLYLFYFAHPLGAHIQCFVLFPYYFNLQPIPSMAKTAFALNIPAFTTFHAS
jgi:hypothetical protein